MEVAHDVVVEPADDVCAFLHLPPEVRNCIYESVIQAHDSNKQPTLFNTCRQIRGEALQLFYATYAFTSRAGGDPQFYRFLDAIDTNPVAVIRNLSVIVRVTHHYAGWSHWEAEATVNICMSPESASGLHGTAPLAISFSRNDIKPRSIEHIEGLSRRMYKYHSEAWHAPAEVQLAFRNLATAIVKEIPTTLKLSLNGDP